jgi:hypothetical protein
MTPRGGKLRDMTPKPLGVGYGRIASNIAKLPTLLGKKEG